MAWKKIEDWKKVPEVPVLLWGGLIEASHSYSRYPYETPVKAYWDGEEWRSCNQVYYDAVILNPTHVRSLPKPPKA